jgi:hypothetical protein
MIKSKIYEIRGKKAKDLIDKASTAPKVYPRNSILKKSYLGKGFLKK